ncbi:hypothetical protein DMC47_06960, partial [Nostoc sp. 3335mG]
MVTVGILALAMAPAPAMPILAATSVIDVPPPLVQDYWTSISRQPGGVLVFDGYAPDQAARDRLGQHPGADVNWLKLGSGAPAGYEAALAFGLSLLDRLEEGRFALRGTVLSVSGMAATQADFLALHSGIAADVPPGFILAMAEVTAPHLDGYAFSLRRQANGNQIVSGYVPSPEVEQQVLAAIGPQASSNLRFASGQPVDFVPMLDRVLPLFARLGAGEIRLENGGWVFSGTPKSPADDEAIRTAFASAPLTGGGWGLALSAPQPEPPVEPYSLTLAKSASGISMSGDVPTEALRDVLSRRIGPGLDDGTAVRSGAPDNFITEALLASDVLPLLERGSIAFDGKVWRIEGEGRVAGAAADIAQLTGGPGKGWTVAVTDPVVAALPPA